MTKDQCKEVKNPGDNGYRPLPEGLIIKDSPIEGKGLFTHIDLDEDVDLGITHIPVYPTHSLYGYIENNLIRTPLGGFINHSEDANCALLQQEEYKDSWNLITLREVKAGEELTVNYLDFNCNDTEP